MSLNQNSLSIHPKKIMDGNVLRNGDYQRDLRGYGFLDGAGRLVGSNIHGSSVRLQLLFGLRRLVRASPRSLLSYSLFHIQPA